MSKIPSVRAVFFVDIKPKEWYHSKNDCERSGLGDVYDDEKDERNCRPRRFIHMLNCDFIGVQV